MKLNSRHFIRISIFFCMATVFSGCTILKGVADSISGNYINGLEKTRKNSKSQVFDYEISECFDKVVTILKQNVEKAEILKMDIYNYSILASVSRTSMQEDIDSEFEGNNADVGIFFREVGQGKTKVEINSLSSPFRDYTAKVIFSQLQK